MRKWILWAGYTLICCYGCAGFLDEAPRDQLPEEDAYDTLANIYLNTVATLYNYVGGYEDSQGLQGTCRGVYDLNTLTTDEPCCRPWRRLVRRRTLARTVPARLGTIMT